MSERDNDVDTVTGAAQRPGGERPEQAQLRVVHPPEQTTTIPLSTAPLVIGRRPEGGRAVQLAHPTVSRQHFRVAWDASAGQHVGRDLDSHNGSSVGGEPVTGEPVPLGDNEVIRLGDVLVVYERNAADDVEDPASVSHQAIPGRAAATRRLRAMVARAGPDPSSVLLVGETGTGKEFIAREIHRLSGRPGELLAVNCAALSPQLVESQLFGHAKGAFTGALAAQPGLFRAADRGTLLLDEVGELAAELQPKLLRVLQEREVLGVGETRPVTVDVRVVASTLRNLVALAREGRFRLDLYARLSLWELRVPPLRQRRADILDWFYRLATGWFAERSVADATLPRLEASAAELLLLQHWPDNLRGLDRFVHHTCAELAAGPVDEPRVRAWLSTSAAAAPAAAALAAAASSSPHHGDEDAGGQGAAVGQGPERAERLPKPTRAELEQVLDAHDGSVRATAKHYGRDRRQIYRWMAQYGLRKKS